MGYYFYHVDQVKSPDALKYMDEVLQRARQTIERSRGHTQSKDLLAIGPDIGERRVGSFFRGSTGIRDLKVWS